MEISVISTIILVSAIQSIFGVGVLLFGTPLLLIMEYSFIEALILLLPLSILINLFQIRGNIYNIDKSVYFKVLIYSVPLIIVFLYIISTRDIDVTGIIGVFLIIIAFKSKIVNQLLSFDKLYFLIMGIIHGLTNLGGALLTAKVFYLDLNKHQKRTTIAISYLTFAIFQLLTLIFLDKISNNYLLLVEYTGLGLMTYFIVNRFIFSTLSNKDYEIYFSIFLIASGILLILKGVK